MGLLGYCQIVTSELEITDGEVLGICKSLVSIEDQFREMKSSLSLRLVIARTPDHIHAHLVVCFLALVMLRLIQTRVREREHPGLEGGQATWRISGTRIVEALNAWAVARMPDGCLARASTTGVEQPREDLNRILEAFGIQIPMDVSTWRDLYQLSRTWSNTIERTDE